MGINLNNASVEIKKITRNYLENNEIAELDQFYSFYLTEYENIKHGDKICSQDEVKEILINNDEINYDLNNDTFTLKYLVKKIDDYPEIASLRDSFNWKVVILINLIVDPFKITLNDLKKELENEIPKLVKAEKLNVELKGPFINITWESGSNYIEIKIKESFLEISSYLIDTEPEFLELVDYVIRRKMDKRDEKDIILLFAQISGAYTAYHAIRNALSTIFNNAIGLEINDISIKREK